MRGGFYSSKWERRCQRAPPSTSGNEWHGERLGVPHASAQPNAATASATISSNPDGSVASAAASSVQPSAAVSAGQRRSRASITATSTSSRCTRAPIISIMASATALHPCAIGWSHATRSVGAATRARARPADSTVLTLVQCACAVRLSGLGDGVPAHAQRTPAQHAANRPSPRDDARAA